MLWQRRLFAVVLGTNEIASAVAVALRREGFAVALSHDPNPPVIRRGMAFHDVLYGTACCLEGVVGQGADCMHEMFASFASPNAMAVTRLTLSDLIAYRAINVLVDGRMQKYTVTPDLRCLAALTVGLGPGFRVNANCDVAVETQPAKSGAVITAGATDAPDGIPALLGAVGRERFAYAPASGCWRSACEIGESVQTGQVIGHLDRRAVAAPLDGALRGLVRDGLMVPVGAKLLEIDPRGDHARCTGIDERPRAIAAAVRRAVRTHAFAAAEPQDLSVGEDADG